MRKHRPCFVKMRSMIFSYRCPSNDHLSAFSCILHISTLAKYHKIKKMNNRRLKEKSSSFLLYVRQISFLNIIIHHISSYVVQVCLINFQHFICCFEWQVTANSVRLVSCTSRELVDQWTAPAGFSVNVASANASQVLFLFRLLSFL